MKKVLSLILAAVICLSALALVSCDKKNDDAGKTIKVAASSTPHAEILEQCKDALAEKGYNLVIEVMGDYIIPNTATESGDVDANYFQHQPYLDDFNASNGTHLVTVTKVHYEPYGIYAGTCASLADLKEGDKIAVDNDPTNGARALLLLEAAGVIKLKEGADLTSTKNDIVENPLNLDIIEMEAALLPAQLDEVAAAVINGNYAIAAGLKIADALATEDAQSTAAQTFANVLVVKEGNEDNEAVKALVEVITSEEIRTFIEEKYEGAVVPVF